MKIHSLAVTAPWESRTLIGGDAYVQHYVQKTKSTTTGINISQTLVLGEGNFAVSSGERSLGMESAFIVDLESDDPDMQIVASDSIKRNKIISGDEISFLLISGKMSLFILQHGYK